jgi:sugar phosphate isomerase/epimerase
MIHEGMENWQWGVEVLGEYLAHVHVKNAKWEVKYGEANGNLVWRASWATMRGGIVNWSDVLSALKKVGYDGYLSNEDFSTEMSTDDKLKDDIEYLKSLE